MPGTFQEKTARWMDNPGGGRLVGKITIDQVYARYQHERRLHHPRGGGPKFLTRALVGEVNRGMQTLASATLRGDLNIAMTRVTERVVQRAIRDEPKEFGDLAKSATVKTIDRGAIVYERRGEHRLSEKEIEARRAGRRRKP